MRKLSLFLCVVLVFSMLCSCQESNETGDKQSSSKGGKGGSTAVSSDVSGSTTTTTTNGGNGGTGEYFDVLEGLPYTIECKDYYKPDETVEYTFSDEGRLNDGLYRSQTELENGSGTDKQVVLSDVRKYRVQITFVDDGTQVGSCLVLQNCDMYYFSELEMGPDLDNLTVVDVETEYDASTGTHTTELIRFEPTTVQAVRITLTIFSRNDMALDEIAILSPENGGDSWTTTTTTTTTTTADTTVTTTNTTGTTTTTRPDGNSKPTDIGNGKNSIVGRWIEHVEGENLSGTVWYSFFDDGTGSMIALLGLVTGTITYTYDENNRYDITIEAKMMGQTDSDSGGGYMYVEGDHLYVVNDEGETATLTRMTDEEYAAVAGYIAEKDIGLRF